MPAGVPYGALFAKRLRAYTAGVLRHGGQKDFDAFFDQAEIVTRRHHPTPFHGRATYVLADANPDAAGWSALLRGPTEMVRIASEHSVAAAGTARRRAGGRAAGSLRDGGRAAGLRPVHDRTGGAVPAGTPPSQARSARPAQRFALPLCGARPSARPASTTRRPPRRRADLHEGCGFPYPHPGVRKGPHRALTLPLATAMVGTAGESTHSPAASRRRRTRVPLLDRRRSPSSVRQPRTRRSSRRATTRQQP